LSALLAIKDLKFSWQGSRTGTVDTPLLHITNWHLARGDQLFLHGPSGSGKSSLLSLLSGIHTGYQGSIQFEGTEWRSLAASQRDQRRVDSIGIIFQQFNLVPYLSALDNVLLPLSFSPRRYEQACKAGSAKPSRSATERARELLTALGLDAGHHEAFSNRLSVGQQQRVAAARALIGEPQLILADEPTSALDQANQQQFIELLLEQSARAKSSVVFVSHDLRLASHFPVVSSLAQLQTGQTSQ
jgi:putative ABC transport system ATP-binding protein